MAIPLENGLQHARAFQGLMSLDVSLKPHERSCSFYFISHPPAKPLSTAVEPPENRLWPSISPQKPTMNEDRTGSRTVY